jgi:hypothetical protein
MSKEKDQVKISVNIATIGKVLLILLGIPSLGASGGMLKEYVLPSVKRVENVQVADAATSEKLDKILNVVVETRERVIKNTSDIEAIKEKQERAQVERDKNARDIEKVEDKVNQ